MRLLSLYIDLAFCLVVLPLMMVILPLERWYTHSPMFVITFVLGLYGTYFLNRFVTVPMLFRGGRRRIVAVCLIGLAVAMAAVLAGADIEVFAGHHHHPHHHPPGVEKPLSPKEGVPAGMEHPGRPHHPQDTAFAPHVGPGPHKMPKHRDLDNLLLHVPPHAQSVWTLFALVEAFSFMVSLLMMSDRQRARRRAVEAERDHAQIQLYKMQIKPHFMFNTLNSLYGLFLTQNPKALEALERFISMMRYMHVNADRDMVAIDEEADYIRQYVELQMLRLGETTTVKLDIDIADHELSVPPMLLMTFAENCFKYGVSSVEKSTIHISLREVDGVLSFKTSNVIFVERQDGEHIGISNCRRRLDLLFPGKYTLDTVREGNMFNVNLKIKLK